MVPADELQPYIRLLDDDFDIVQPAWRFARFALIGLTAPIQPPDTSGPQNAGPTGLPVPREDHAEVIANLALEMKHALDRLNQILDYPLKVRIGINSGAVVAGVIGKKKFAYDLWGESVNTASRMESHGVAGHIQVGEATYELIKDNYILEDRGEIDIKGRAPMHAYLLKSKRELE